MGTTKEEISTWFDAGVALGATHMIVACDTFDHEDYPVYVKFGEDVHEKYKEYNGQDMQRVMEVYSLRLPKDGQLAEFRAFHFD